MKKHFKLFLCLCLVQTVSSSYLRHRRRRAKSTYDTQQQSLIHQSVTDREHDMLSRDIAGVAMMKELELGEIYQASKDQEVTWTDEDLSTLAESVFELGDASSSPDEEKVTEESTEDEVAEYAMTLFSSQPTDQTQHQTQQLVHEGLTEDELAAEAEDIFQPKLFDSEKTSLATSVLNTSGMTADQIAYAKYVAGVQAVQSNRDNEYNIVTQDSVVGPAYIQSNEVKAFEDEDTNNEKDHRSNDPVVIGQATYHSNGGRDRPRQN